MSLQSEMLFSVKDKVIVITGGGTGKPNIYQLISVVRAYNRADSPTLHRDWSYDCYYAGE